MNNVSEKELKRGRIRIIITIIIDDDDDDNRTERRDSIFFSLTISSLRRELSPTRTLKWPGRNRVQITCNTSGAHHVQRVVCHWVRKDSSDIEFDRVEIAFT